MIIFVYKGQQTYITYAEIIGGYDVGIESPYGTVSITVNYDVMLSFLYYGVDIKWYILYSFIVVGFVFAVICFIANRLKMPRLG